MERHRPIGLVGVALGMHSGPRARALPSGNSHDETGTLSTPPRRPSCFPSRCRPLGLARSLTRRLQPEARNSLAEPMLGRALGEKRSKTRIEIFRREIPVHRPSTTREQWLAERWAATRTMPLSGLNENRIIDGGCGSPEPSGHPISLHDGRFRRVGSEASMRRRAADPSTVVTNGDETMTDA